MSNFDVNHVLAGLQAEFTSPLPESGVRPSVPRKPMRSTAERWLPDFPSLVALAQCWLDEQHKHWPTLASSGEIPASTPAEAERLAKDFQKRFLMMEAGQYRPQTVLPEGTKIGAAYSRFSCDKKTPDSIQQQLHRILQLARKENVFVPWTLVFGDAGTSGLVSARHCYRLLKTVMTASSPACFSVLYLDEVSRLSRRLVETLAFIEEATALNIRVVWVTQNFDTTTTMGRMIMTILGHMAEQVSRETSSRCERGRDHAWRITNTALKPPALGYCQVVARDANGQPLLGSGQRQLYREIIDPATAPYVKLAFMLRAQQHKSRTEIARIFNSMNVGGRNCWGDGGIRLLLQRQDYVGVEICNRVKNVWQPKTGLYKAVPQPENLWKKRPMPHKRIITDELFNAVQAVEKRIADS